MTLKSGKLKSPYLRRGGRCLGCGGETQGTHGQSVLAFLAITVMGEYKLMLGKQARSGGRFARRFARKFAADGRAGPLL